MSSQAHVASGDGLAGPAALPATRPFYWSVRREWWENRSIHVAPLAVAGFILFGFLVSTIHPPANLHQALADPAQQRATIQMPYDVAAAMLVLTAFLVAFFYSLDALHGERQDRSVLFWKSLPVSDLTAVLAKASIPLVVLPIVTFVVAIGTQLVILLFSLILPRHSVSAATLWRDLPLVHMWLGFLYALVIMALWLAPIYGWLLIVSGWARRATFLWAVLVPVAIGAVEKLAFNTIHFWVFLRDRLIGWIAQGFVTEAQHGAQMDPLAALAPGRFFSSAGLWVGLVVAAAFLAVVVRLRRHQGPI